MHKICGQSLCIITHCTKCRISGCRPAEILYIFSLDKCCRLCYTETARARTASAPMCHGIRIPLPWYPLPLYPWYPMPTTYIHTCIDTFVLFIYLIVFVFVYLIVFVSLTLLFSLVLSPLALSLPLARPALGQRQQVLLLLYVSMFYFI